MRAREVALQLVSRISHDTTYLPHCWTRGSQPLQSLQLVRMPSWPSCVSPRLVADRAARVGDASYRNKLCVSMFGTPRGPGHVCGAQRAAGWAVLWIPPHADSLLGSAAMQRARVSAATLAVVAGKGTVCFCTTLHHCRKAGQLVSGPVSAHLATGSVGAAVRKRRMSSATVLCFVVGCCLSAMMMMVVQ